MFSKDGFHRKSTLHAKFLMKCVAQWVLIFSFARKFLFMIEAIVRIEKNYKFVPGFSHY